MKISHKTSIFGAILGTFVLSSVPKSAQAAPVIKTVSPAGLKAAVAQNKGKVVIVNFWATWCSSCLKEMPALAKLKRANASKGVVVMLVSGDENDNQTNIAKAMQQRGHSRTYLIKGGFEKINDFGNAFDPQNVGPFEFPRTYIYNRKGQLVKKFVSAHTQTQLQNIINPYL